MRYLGKPWTEEQDCYYWFREIQRHEFGRDLPPIVGLSQSFTAMRLIARGPEMFGGIETSTPREGDAVFMSQRRRPRHIGTLIFMDGMHYVLHALKGSGVILSNNQSLLLNGWRIDGYWTDTAN